jgi:cytochrome c biogenesis protein CcmG/thiol:disulfide interchange protein DsbE
MRYFALALLVGLGALFLWGLHRPDQGKLPSMLVGEPAPPINLPLLPPFQATWGKEFHLARYLGHTPILVNIWASWCDPSCYMEAPYLEAAWKKYRGKILFVGVDTQDTQQGGLSFVRQFGYTFPQVFDPEGQVAVAYGTYGVPETFLINQKGDVVLRHAGPLGPQHLAQLIAKVLP